MSKPGQAVSTSSGPSFEYPPVVETALGIQFEELEAFNAAAFGLYYEHVRRDFPRLTEHDRVAPLLERFPPISAQRVVSMQIGGATRSTRVWYETESRDRLIQLQADRFGFNWKQPDKESKYPRWNLISQEALDKFQDFVAFAGDKGLGEVRPNYCEVVYVNKIFPAEGDKAISLFPEVFTGIHWKHSTNFLPSPELATLNRTYEIPDQRGRLYAEATLGLEPTEKKEWFILLKMTARVKHLSRSIANVLEPLQIGHDWIVNGFESLTNESIRKQRWRQK